MKCGIHQPQFLPWLGYLHKINYVDKFVFLDNVQFKKNEFQNRNRTIVSEKIGWLTVPVKFNFGDTLCETKIADAVSWRKKIFRTISQSYAKAPFFQQFGKELLQLLEQDWQTIAELNEATVRWLVRCFDIRTELFVSSNLPVTSADPTQRLIDICHHVGSDTYVSGMGGHNYLSTETFEEAGITLEFQEFKHPVYPQSSIKKGSDFVPYLSAIDGLFNCGGSAAGREKLNLDPIKRK